MLVGQLSKLIDLSTCRRFTNSWNNRLNQGHAVRGFNCAAGLLPAQSGAYRMSGDLDDVMRVEVADVADCVRRYEKLIEMVPLRYISACFVLESTKDTTSLPVS